MASRFLAGTTLKREIRLRRKIKRFVSDEVEIEKPVRQEE